jgi:endonuclease/exonuclease/phosphatase family metal-dependent hydrolase
VTIGLELEVLTWNVFLRPAIADRFEGLRTHPLERARRIADALNSDPAPADVLVFNEVFHDAARACLLETLSRQRWPHRTSVLRKTWLFNAGVLVASRLPFASEARGTKFSEQRLPDSGAGKGFLHVQLSAERGSLHLLATHLQAEGAGVRAAQLAQIRRYIDAEIPRDRTHAVLIAGDLNVDLHDPGEYPRMLELLGADHLPRTGPPYSLDAEENAFARHDNVRKHLDYVLFSAQAEHAQPARDPEGRMLTAPLRSATPWGTLERRGLLSLGRRRAIPIRDFSDHFAVRSRLRFTGAGDPLP